VECCVLVECSGHRVVQFGFPASGKIRTGGLKESQMAYEALFKYKDGVKLYFLAIPRL
jgi:hypothetical protein